MVCAEQLLKSRGGATSDIKRSTIWLKASAAAPVLLVDTGVPLSPPAETLGSKGIEPRSGHINLGC